METKANEPAFPNIQTPSLKGLTKREYLAAMVLGGMLAGKFTTTSEYYAIDAVRIADVLIEELNKTKTNEKK